MTTEKNLVQFGGCLILADTPFDLIERVLIGQPEAFTPERMIDVAADIVLGGFEVLHGEREYLITGELKLTYILARNYTYISMS